MTKGLPIPYTIEELFYIYTNRKMLRREAHKLFCERFNRHELSLDAYKAICNRRGWKTGRTGCFDKGLTPHNKGKKMAYNANRAATQFKKGNEPHNANYLGHERITKDGYIEISVAETNPHTGYPRTYILKHRHEWEQKNGKLPKGMCLKCLDGNKKNTDPSNWEAIPRGVSVLISGRSKFQYDHMPEELKPSVLMMAKVKHAKSEAVRKNEN